MTDRSKDATQQVRSDITELKIVAAQLTSVASQMSEMLSAMVTLADKVMDTVEAYTKIQQDLIAQQEHTLINQHPTSKQV